MDTESIQMSGETMLKLLNTLNVMLEENDERLELLIIGGAHMCLVQMSRHSSHDIDTYTKDKELVFKYRDLIRAQVNNKIDKTWINAVGDMFVTQEILNDAYLLYNFSNLKIYTPTDRAMLALKVASGRKSNSWDLDDAAFLIKKLGLSNPADIKLIVDCYKPGTWNKFGYHEDFCNTAVNMAYS